MPEPSPPPVPMPDFERMYAEQFDYVARSLRRLGAQPRDLKDLCQEVFLAAYRKRDAFDPTRPLRPWLFGIAFRAVSELRNRAWVQREVGEENAAELSVEPRLDEVVSEGEARQLVLAALQKLPAERRAVFIMHDLDGCSAPEISEVVGVPLNTVYSRLRVARDEFATAVKRLNPERGAS